MNYNMVEYLARLIGKLKTYSVILENPPLDLLGLSGQSGIPPKHILKVKACFSKCLGYAQIIANLPVLIMVVVYHSC